MKMRFYRLSSSRWFARLLSILAFAAVGLYYPSAAFAVYCAAKVGATCQLKSGLTCGGTTPIKCKLTSSGWSSLTGSDISTSIVLSDMVVSTVKSDPSKCPGPPGDSYAVGDFFDTTANTNAGQAIDCTHDDQPALCSFINFQCSCFRVGDCNITKKIGTRTNTMQCPTPSFSGVDADNDGFIDNVAGCTGTVEVRDLDGNLIETVFVGGKNGLDLAPLDTQKECGAALPSAFGLKQRVFGILTQKCTSGSDFTTDPILEERVRSTQNYFSTTTWRDERPCEAQPANGWPPHSCENDSGAWIYFDAAANGEQCVAANFSCGQVAGEPGSAPTNGPPPSKCEPSGSLCRCRCDRCTVAGTLGNVGTGDLGSFALSSSINAYVCPIEFN